MFRILAATSLTFWVATFVIGQNGPAISNSAELRLAADQSTTHIGDARALRVKVDLWNKGDEDFIAGGTLAPIINAPSYMILEFTDEKGAKHSGSVITVWMNDQIRNEWWVRIAPGHYYGAEFDLDTKTYPFMAVPGIYEIVAKYVSKGGTTRAIPELSVPSYHVWEGEIRSNPVHVTVLPKKTPSE